MSNYPAGTDTADAPWNRPDAPSYGHFTCQGCDRSYVLIDATGEVYENWLGEPRHISDDGLCVQCEEERADDH